MGVVSKELHQLLFWLVFDLGENINSQLRLKRKDFTRQINPTNGDPEYRINYRKEILKRSRTPRSEITNFPKTVELLDIVLPTIDNDKYINFLAINRHTPKAKIQEFESKRLTQKLDSTIHKLTLTEHRLKNVESELNFLKKNLKTVMAIVERNPGLDDVENAISYKESQNTPSYIFSP